MKKRRMSLLKTSNKTQMEPEQEEEMFCYAMSKLVSSIPLLGKCHSLFARRDGKAE